MPYRIETKRLLLRRLADSDLSGLIAMLGSPKVTHWLFSGKPMDSQNARSFIEKEFTFGDQPVGLGTLCEKSPENVIGFAGIIPCRYFGNEDFEFGVALNEDSWGKGYGKEIAEAQIKFGFENLLLDRLLALAHSKNVASLKVIESVGMKFLKEILTEERGPRCVYFIQRDRALKLYLVTASSCSMIQQLTTDGLSRRPFLSLLLDLADHMRTGK